MKSIPNILITAFIAISLQTSSKRPRKPQGDDGDNGKCELIGTFSLITQALLGLLCLSSLIAKRFYEYPLRRTWPVWFFDVLKQLIGAFGVHIFNVFLSILKTSEPLEIGGLEKLPEDDLSGSDDPCDWYFLNIVFDCTIGVLVLYFVFSGVNKVLQDWLQVTEIDSGQYGPDPEKPSTRAFLKQLTVYFGSLMITKLILYGIVECFETQLLWITSHVLLVWLDEYPDEFEIFVVMFIVPVVMNCLQLILVDNIIQNPLIGKVNGRLHHEHDAETDEDEQDIRDEIQEYIGDEEHRHRRDKKYNIIRENDRSKNYGTFNEDTV